MVNDKIKKLCERCLRIAYNDKKWEINKSVRVHMKNLQVLATEMLKVMSQLFQLITS